MTWQRDETNKKKKKSSWRFNLQAKPKLIQLKFQTTNIFLFVSLFPINFTLTLTKSNPPFEKSKRSIKSKFLSAIRKLRFFKSDSAVDDETLVISYPQRRFCAKRSKFVAYEEPKCMASIVIGFIALLSRSISQMDQLGIIVYTSLIIFLFVALVFSNLIWKRSGRILIVTLFLAAIAIYLSSIFKNLESSFFGSIYGQC